MDLASQRLAILEATSGGTIMKTCCRIRLNLCGARSMLRLPPCRYPGGNDLNPAAHASARLAKDGENCRKVPETKVTISTFSIDPVNLSSFDRTFETYCHRRIENNYLRFSCCDLIQIIILYNELLTEFKPFVRHKCLTGGMFCYRHFNCLATAFAFIHKANPSFYFRPPDRRQDHLIIFLTKSLKIWSISTVDHNVTRQTT